MSPHRPYALRSQALTSARFCLDGSFVIYFFLGDFAGGAEGVKWLHEPKLVGSSAVFASSKPRTERGECANCRTQKAGHMKYKDTVGLTQALVKYWRTQEEVHGLKVASLRPDAVVPFLTRNLHWRIVDVSSRSRLTWK